MSRTVTVFLVATIIFLAVLGYVFYATPAGPGVQPNDADNPSPKMYTNAVYGISFQYPDTYEISEREAGDAHRGHYAITLTRKADLPPPQNGEGPPTVSIDIHQNDIDNMSLLGWLLGTNAGNFKLSDGTYASTTISGREAVRYRWSGLYEADAVAFLHNDWFVTISGTYLDPNDSIRRDFQTVVSSFILN
ncbi:MAG: hypothetical protein Q8R25_03410 [bacterium]|nr:hypothetical protein [bacterium]